MFDMGDVSKILGMNVTFKRENGAITISRKYYTEDVIQCYGISGCNPAYTSAVGPELSLNQSEDKVLNEAEKRRYQVITEAVMYLAQVTRYGHLKARQISCGGDQAPDSLLGHVHRLLHHLQAGRP